MFIIFVINENSSNEFMSGKSGKTLTRGKAENKTENEKKKTDSYLKFLESGQRAAQLNP
jgi:hypothetical protein